MEQPYWMRHINDARANNPEVYAEPEMVMSDALPAATRKFIETGKTSQSLDSYKKAKAPKKTTLSDNDYMASLKINDQARFDKLAGKAFDVNNPVAIALQKRLSALNAKTEPQVVVDKKVAPAVLPSNPALLKMVNAYNEDPGLAALQAKYMQAEMYDPKSLEVGDYAGNPQSNPYLTDSVDAYDEDPGLAALQEKYGVPSYRPSNAKQNLRTPASGETLSQFLNGQHGQLPTPTTGFDQWLKSRKQPIDSGYGF